METKPPIQATPSRIASRLETEHFEVLRRLSDRLAHPMVRAGEGSPDENKESAGTYICHSHHHHRLIKSQCWDEEKSGGEGSEKSSERVDYVDLGMKGSSIMNISGKPLRQKR